MKSQKVMKALAFALTLVVAATLLVGCGGTPAPTKAPEPTAAPAPTKAPEPTAVPAPTEAPVEGVTAAQVQALMQEKFNTADRDLTLWNIQPGLGTIMMEYGRRFIMVKESVDAGDWGMAQYQLKEQTEIQEVGEVTRSAHAEELKSFEHAYLDTIATAIQDEDADAFKSAYDAAIDGCNACHVATGHPYIEFQYPENGPQDFLSFEASDSVAPGESSPAAEAETASDQVLSWQEMTDMVTSYFNTADRSLTLWAIQPGLGTVMMEYGKRFATVKHAVDAGDWGMAQYQLKEQTEIQEVGEITRSGHAEELKSFEHAYLDTIATAIENKDADAFNAAYTAAIDGCNACHVATGHAYVRYQMPPTSPQPFLNLTDSDPAKPGESSPAETAEVTFPEGNPTLDDATQLVNDIFNNTDRSLALWGIQPGLGTVMIEYAYRFGNVWFAAEGGNWDLAAYQLKEQTEIQEVGEVTRSGHAEELATFEHAYLDTINDAITAQDLPAFEDAYTAAIDGCNACHATTGHPYVRFQAPTNAPANFLNMSPVK